MPDFLQKITEYFKQEPDVTKMGFLTTFFRTLADSFTDGEFLDYDAVRTGAEIAPAVRSLSAGGTLIVEDEFTNKQVPFPVFNIGAPVSLSSLMKRMPGESAYLEQKVNWQARIARKLVSSFADMSRMLRFAIEGEAAQVLQTGIITLNDENGNPVYTLDLKPKASHFPESTVGWDQSGASPLDDIRALSSVVRQDGFVDVTTLVFGTHAWDLFYANAAVKDNLKQDNLNMGALNPRLVDKGAGYMGYIFIGPYRYDLYVYDAFYTPFGSTTPVNFLDPNKVLFLPNESSLDFRRYFGGIPNIQQDPVFDPIFGGRITVDNEYDFRPRVFFDEPRETYIGEIKSRPLMLPVSIDRYGCLTTVSD